MDESPPVDVAALFRSEERFRLLVESVRDYAIFMLDPTGHVTTWNIGATRIKGWAATEIIGQHFSVFYQPADVARGVCERELEIAARDGRFEDEGYRVRKDGTLLWANVIITALRDDRDVLVGFAKVTRDLSREREAEGQRLQLARLEEAQQRREEFLAILGHELRNPLAPMVMAVALLKGRGLRGAEDEIGILDRQLKQLTRLLDDLMDASWSLRERLELARSTIEVADALTPALDIAASLAKQRGQTLAIDVPRVGLLVDVDPERITQVFGNLLRNAAKYTPPGGHLRVTAAPSDGGVEIRFQDDGAGLAAEMLGVIFDLFAQVPQPLDRPAGGLGVGLAVARRIVHAHGGHIEAESAGLGEGSTFVVRLPAGRASATPPLSVPVRSGAARARRVLVVDDNEDAAELYRRLLEREGHVVEVAHEGRDAVDRCVAFGAEVVFLDIGLPGISGFDVVRLLREQPGGERLVVVAVTGYATQADRERALRAGFTAHLAKPVGPDDLLAILRTHV